MQTMVSTAGVLVQPSVGAASIDNEPDTLEPGAKAGPWIIERELGRGGMGAVYGVVHEEIGKRAALKVMHRRLVGNSSAERILLEARVVNRVGHPNIVDIFETGTLGDGRPYIVMERLEGVPLSFRADEGKMMPDQIIGILLQVCDALIAAHTANIVHRDLKLDNVFLTDNPDDPCAPRVKLLDWGIAKVISNDVRHTIEGQLVGTPQYLAPEQARGAAVSPQTDVYSLGVMAYELFLEQLPFEAETSAEIMAMHLRCTPPPPRELWPDIPVALEHLVLAMLAKDPLARPTMLMVAHELERIRGDFETRKQTPADASVVSTSTMPPARRSSRHDVANGFSPTEPATARHGQRRWRVAVGALAIAASATLFWFMRDTDPANAAPHKREPVQHVVHSTVEAPAAPTPSPASATDDHIVHAAAAAMNEPPATAPALPASAVKSRKHPPTRKAAPVTPRRSQHIDPDGTVDPYL